jgi:hydroxypyruvate isomerase
MLARGVDQVSYEYEGIMFSANLGFLYTDLPMVERILAARNSGFDAVECHYP